MSQLKNRFLKLTLGLCAATAFAAISACSQTAPAPVTAATAQIAAAAPAAAPAPAPAVEAAEAPVVAAMPTAPKKVVHKVMHKKHPVMASVASPSPTQIDATPAPPRTPITVCGNCGVITAITPVQVSGKGTAIGVITGGLAGLAVGNQIGDGNGKTIAKIAGAAGGAFLGNKLEKRIRAETHYEIKVRFDNGSETTVSQDNQPTLPVGSDVRVVDGTVIAK